MSRYTNYVMKNNVFAELYAPISSLATTIQLKSGQGARRGSTFPILATLESVDSNGKVTKREIVKVTGISGDYLTVVRGFAPCPANDDANSQGTTTFSFEADDRINMYVPKEIFDKIGDTLNDIYENGLNKLRVDVISGLQIHVGAGPVLVGSAYYDFAGDDITLTDNATNYVEIDENGDLVANTSAWGNKNTKIAKVTTSGGAVTSIEDRRLGTVGGEIGGVNIHDLTEKTSLSANDEFILADSDNVYNNKKVKYGSFGHSIIYNGLTAGENLSAGDIVTNIGNQLFKATISNQGAPHQMWIVRKAANTGEYVEADILGVSKVFTGLTAGANYFVSNTAGELTTTRSGGFIVGKALNSTDLDMMYTFIDSDFGTDTTLATLSGFSDTFLTGSDLKVTVAYQVKRDASAGNCTIYTKVNGATVDTFSTNQAGWTDHTCNVTLVSGDVISFEANMYFFSMTQAPKITTNFVTNYL